MLVTSTAICSSPNQTSHQYFSSTYFEEAYKVHKQLPFRKPTFHLNFWKKIKASRREQLYSSTRHQLPLVLQAFFSHKYPAWNKSSSTSYLCRWRLKQPNMHQDKIQKYLQFIYCEITHSSQRISGSVVVSKVRLLLRWVRLITSSFVKTAVSEVEAQGDEAQDLHSLMPN